MNTPNPTPETPTPLGLLPLPPTPLTNKLESEFEQAEYTNAVCKLFSHAKDLERALAEAKRENEQLRDRLAGRAVDDSFSEHSWQQREAELETENARLKAERQWQPIETAPQYDGTVILGFSQDWIHPDYNPSGVRECFRDGDGFWKSPEWNNYQDVYETGDGEPTHWMPLPAARTQEGQG